METKNPVWVDQRPVNKEKLSQLYKLFEEQLWLGLLESSVSHWNTPFFVIPKKSGKWKLL